MGIRISSIFNLQSSIPTGHCHLPLLLLFLFHVSRLTFHAFFDSCILSPVFCIPVVMGGRGIPVSRLTSDVSRLFRLLYSVSCILYSGGDGRKGLTAFPVSRLTFDVSRLFLLPFCLALEPPLNGLESHAIEGIVDPHRVSHGGIPFEVESDKDVLGEEPSLAK